MPRKKVAKDGRSLIGPDGKHMPSQQAGRKGAAKPKKPRCAAPASEAIPATMEFPVSDKRWKVYCDNFASNGGKIRPAADAAGLSHVTVGRWYDWAAEGKEPWRKAVEQAMTALGVTCGAVGAHMAKRNPEAFLHGAYPDEYPDPRARSVEVSGALDAPVELLERIRRSNAEGPEGDE